MKLPYYLLCLLLMSVSSAQATIFKIATLAPDGTAWMQKMRESAEQIKQQTSGRVILKFYPGGVMGSDDNVLRKIRIGQLQGGAVTTGNASAIQKDIDIYGLPFLFNSLDQVDYVRKQMDATLIKKLEDGGFVSFGLAEGGFAYMMSEHPIRTVADLSQQKVWSPSGNEVAEAVFSGAGITPVPLPLSDVLTAMQTGLIDTVIASPIGVIALQWHTRIKYVIDVPLTYLSGLLVIDKKAFDKLSTNDAALVRKVMAETFREIDVENRKDNIAAREALKNQGIEFIALSEESLKSWHDIGVKATKKLEEKGAYSKASYEELVKLIKQTEAVSVAN
jgi:TRAP-type C4-dicarboxylate transport system substrate-binding protein